MQQPVDSMSPATSKTRSFKQSFMLNPYLPTYFDQKAYHFCPKSLFLGLLQGGHSLRGCSTQGIPVNPSAFWPFPSAKFPQIPVFPSVSQFFQGIFHGE